MSARMMMVHRRAAPVRRLMTATDVEVVRPAGLVAREPYAPLLVEGTSLEAGEHNRRKLVRARRARRLVRTTAMPLILGLAIASGLAIGQMGQGTREVRTIAPTRQPVYHAISTASLLPLALLPANHAAS